MPICFQSVIACPTTTKLLPLIAASADRIVRGCDPRMIVAGGWDCTSHIRFASAKADAGIRTPNLAITNRLLYLLSYIGITAPDRKPRIIGADLSFQAVRKRGMGMNPSRTAGLEPASRKRHSR